MEELASIMLLIMVIPIVCEQSCRLPNPLMLQVLGRALKDPPIHGVTVVEWVKVYLLLLFVDWQGICPVCKREWWHRSDAVAPRGEAKKAQLRPYSGRQWRSRLCFDWPIWVSLCCDWLFLHHTHACGVSSKSGDCDLAVSLRDPKLQLSWEHPSALGSSGGKLGLHQGVACTRCWSASTGFIWVRMCLGLHFVSAPSLELLDHNLGFVQVTGRMKLV